MQFKVGDAVKFLNETGSGEIVEINEDLADNLELFKSGAYEGAWIAKIKVDGSTEFETLMNAEDYENLLKE